MSDTTTPPAAAGTTAGADAVQPVQQTQGSFLRYVLLESRAVPYFLYTVAALPIKRALALQMSHEEVLKRGVSLVQDGGEVVPMDFLFALKLLFKGEGIAVWFRVLAIDLVFAVPSLIAANVGEALAIRVVMASGMDRSSIVTALCFHTLDQFTTALLRSPFESYHETVCGVLRPSGCYTGAPRSQMLTTSLNVAVLSALSVGVFAGTNFVGGKVCTKLGGSETSQWTQFAISLAALCAQYPFGVVRQRMLASLGGTQQPSISEAIIEDGGWSGLLRGFAWHAAASIISAYVR